MLLKGLYSGPAETDIIYRVGRTPGNAVGTTFCNNAASERRCDQHYVTFREQPEQPVACHETGHSVGLLHPTEAVPRRDENNPAFFCMVNNPVFPSETFLGPHNAELINDTY